MLFIIFGLIILFFSFRPKRGGVWKSVNGNGRDVTDSILDDSFEEIIKENRLELAPPDLTLGFRGLTDPGSGQPLSLDAAISRGVFDTATGEFLAADGDRINLGEAVERKLIDAKLADILAGHCGIFDPKSGRQLSLLEAIHQGLFDPKSKKFIDPVTGEAVTVEHAAKLGFLLHAKVSTDDSTASAVCTDSSELSLSLLATMAPPARNKVDLLHAVRSGLVDTRTGQFTTGTGQQIPLTKSISQGYINVEPTAHTGLSLSDAVRQGVVRVSDGRIIDRNTGLAFTLTEAIQRGLVSKDRHEVYDDQQSLKLTLEEALAADIIDATEGRYILEDGGRLTLDQAAKQHRLENPLTIKEAVDQQLVDESDSFVDPVTGESISLLSAVGRGILDAELKAVRDVKAGVYLSLGQALGQGIVKPSGSFTDTLTGESMSLGEAVKKGLLTSVCQKTIFEIEGIKNPLTGDYVSFNEALTLGLLDKNNSTFFDKKTLTRMTLHEAVEKDYIQPQLLDMLEKPVGIVVLGTELNLLQAVMNRRLDPLSGLLLDPAATNTTLPLEVAVAKGLISPMGAAILKSLLNITVTTATVTQTVRRTMKVSSLPSKAESKEEMGTTITFQEALRRGLIDEATGLFTDPESGREIALDEAISLGIIKLGQQQAVRKSSAATTTTTTASRKNSVSSVASSRKSSDASSRSSSSPPKSLASAKEFLKESSAREGRSSSLTTSFRMTSQSTTKNESSSSSSHACSTHGSTTTSKQGSPVGPSSRGSPKISSLGGSRNNSPDKKASSKSPAISPKRSPGKRLDRLDSFEKRMEERSELFAADSKLDYSYRSLNTSSTRTIPIRREDDGELLPPLIDVPLDGYRLEEAISSGLFDPVAGLLRLPGMERETCFAECLDLNIINPASATILSYGQLFSLKTAVERRILDTTGHYITTTGSLINMKEAIEAGFVTFDTYMEDETTTTTTTSSSTMRKLTENIQYDTASGTYEVNPDIQPGELMSALKEGKILPSDIKVEDPASGTKEGGNWQRHFGLGGKLSKVYSWSMDLNTNRMKIGIRIRI